MAASQISHNTPVAGSITWTGFNIAYAGQSYAVPGGSTAGRFVWWEYRNGTPATMTGDVLPELGPDDIILFLNKSGIGSLVPATSVVDGSLIVEESIMAPAIGADQINGGHIEADAVQAKHVAAGAITADALSVGTVSANLVANGSFEDFDENATIIGWEVAAMTSGSITPVTGVASSGAVAIQLDATSTTADLRLVQAPAKLIPVSAASGRKWYASARMGAGTATTKGAFLRANWYDANRVFLSSSAVVSDVALATSFAVFEGQATPPSTARFMGLEVAFTQPNVAAKMYVDEVTAYEVLMSAHIGEGQVTATKIKGDAIDGKTITGATVRTAESGARVQLDMSGLRAFDATGAETVKISAADGSFSGTGDFTARNEKGMVQLTPSTQVGGGRPGVALGEDSATIYGPMLFGADPTKTATDGFSAGDAVLVSGQAVSGGGRSQLVLQQDGEIRLQAMGGAMDTQGFYLDPTNGVTIAAPKTTVNGDLIARGQIQTAPDGYPGLVLLNTNDGYPGIWFSSTGGTGGSEPAIYADPSFNIIYRGASRMQGPVDMGSTGSGYYVRFQSGFPGFYIRNDGTNGPEKGADAAIWSPSNANTMHLRAPLIGSRGAVRIDSGSQLEYYDPPTSTFGANVGISTSPKDRFYKLTSKRSSKVNIHDFPVEKAAKVLDLSPRLWLDRTQVEERIGKDVVQDPDGPEGPKVAAEVIAEHKLKRQKGGPRLREVPGLVAEEVEAVGLSEYVVYTDDPETDEQKVEGVSYDRMWTLLIPLVKELRERVATLEAEKAPRAPHAEKIAALEQENAAQAEALAALEARLAALEAK
jgi:hypothetical protein